MGVVQNIIGMVRDINDHRENAKIKDVLVNNLDQPDVALRAAYQINPTKGLALQDEFATRAAAKAAAEDATFKRKQDRFGLIAKQMRGVAPEHMSEAFDRFTPMFTSLGVDPDTLAAVKAQAIADPNYLSSLDDETYKLLFKDAHTNTVAPVGSHVIRGDKVIDSVPYGYKPVTVGSAQTGYTSSAFDPNTGAFGTPDAPDGTENAVNPGLPADANIAPPAAAAPVSGAPAGWSDPGATGMTVDNLAPHFRQQESHDDYTAVSSKGALGAYQVMPATGRALAQRLGVAWRPDMMQKDDPVSRRYQDAIGREAIHDAVVAGGGNPDETFAYYHAGPDPDMRGPKTAQYVTDMKNRVGLGRPDGQHATVSRSGITVPAAPPKPGKDYRAATPKELADAGYPEGTAGQVDQDGKFVNLKTPTAGKKAATAAPAALKASYRDAKGSIAELRKNINDVINDPDLGYATGAVGSVLKHLPGTSRQRIDARLKQINTQKLMSIVKTLKANGGNPFSRITNYEAQILPTTLGDFNLDQNKDDVISTGKRALQQLDELEQMLDQSGKEAGFVSEDGRELPVVGEIRKGYKFKGGDPTDPASWEKTK